jgi:hypothetical protein
MVYSLILNLIYVIALLISKYCFRRTSEKQSLPQDSFINIHIVICVQDLMPFSMQQS